MIKVMTGDYTMLDTMEIDDMLDTMFSETFYSYILSSSEETESSSLIVYRIEFVNGDEVTIGITEYGITLHNALADLSYYLIPESYENSEEELVDKVFEMISAWVGLEGDK